MPVTNRAFAEEFVDILADWLSLMGDINLPLNKHDNPNNGSFIESLRAIGLSQSVQFPAHRAGNNLDAILVKDNQNFDKVNVTQGSMNSDHHAVIAAACSIPKPDLERKEMVFRRLGSINTDTIVS